MTCDARRRALEQAYRRTVHCIGHATTERMSRGELLTLVIESPAPRLYITPEQAGRIVRRYLTDGAASIERMRSCQARRRATYLVQRVLPLIAAGVPLSQAATQTVYSPAPSFFISTDTARKLI